MNKQKVIRKIGNTFYVLSFQTILEMFGKKYKDSWWLECDEEGNVKDSNKNGKIDRKSYLCVIPEGCNDIDLSTLSEDCLEPEK